MQDNFTNDTAEMLIKYMDGELDETGKTAVENILQTDALAQAQYQFFLAAKQSVRSQGIRQRVAGIQREYLQERKEAENISIPKKKRSSFFTPFMSAAAVLLFLLIGYTTFQYVTTTNQKVYEDAYFAYQLPVNRGNEKAAAVENSYNAGDYKAVITAFNLLPAKSTKDYFIAGLAFLQMNDAKSAVTSFQEIEKLNSTNERKQYIQETDYYLLLSYLKAGDISNAEKKLDEIRSNKEHLFYEKAASISRMQLMILKWKEK